MEVSIVVAKDENNLIGKSGEGIPWHIPVDLVRFKEITEGGTVIMGRKTFESIGQPLVDRKNIVLSTTEDEIEGCEVVSGFDEALEACDDEEVFVIGGERPYRHALEVCDKIYMTIVDGEHEGDTYFPEVDRSQWQVTNWSSHPDHSFFELERQ